MGYHLCYLRCGLGPGEGGACGPMGEKKSTFGRQILYRVMENGAKNFLNADFFSFLSFSKWLSVLL